MKTFLTMIILLSTLCPAQINGGKVLHLDGQNDYVQLFEPIIKDIPFTIEVWAKMFGPGGGISQQNPIFEQRTLATVINAPSLVMAYNDGRGNTTWTIRDYDHYNDQARAPRPPINQWHHIAGVVTREQILLYIDGELIHSVYHSQTGPFDEVNDHVTIGRHAYLEVVGGYLNGYIDELRIWNCARSQEEILADMFQPLDMENSDIQQHL